MELNISICGDRNSLGDGILPFEVTDMDYKDINLENNNNILIPFLGIPPKLFTRWQYYLSIYGYWDDLSFLLEYKMDKEIRYIVNNSRHQAIQYMLKNFFRCFRNESNKAFYDLNFSYSSRGIPPSKNDVIANFDRNKFCVMYDLCKYFIMYYYDHREDFDEYLNIKKENYDTETGWANSFTFYPFNTPQLNSCFYDHELFISDPYIC